MGLLCSTQNAFSQQPPPPPPPLTQFVWKCKKIWSAGDPIGHSYYYQMPSINGSTNVIASPNAVFTLSLEFGDLDYVTGNSFGACYTGPEQYTEANYTVKYTTDNNTELLFFTGGGTLKSDIDGSLYIRGQQQVGGITVAVIATYPVFLQIQPTWNGTPITITATVTDISPPPQYGTVQDPIKTFTWTINPGTNFPSSLLKVNGPDNTTWTPNTASFTYQAIPDIGLPGQPDYQNQVVSEIFVDMDAGSLFSLSDLNDTWIDNNSIGSTDEAVKLIFKYALMETFTLDNNDQFIDTHSGYKLNEGIELGQVFTPAAAMNGNIGYQVYQEYNGANGSLIKTTKILRKLTGTILNGVFTLNPNGLEVQKIH